MKSPDEIKKGLLCCAMSSYRCEDDCPYREQCRYEQGGKAMNEDALSLIQQLEADVESLRKFGENLSARNEELHGKLIDLEAERDALMHYLHSMGCDTCLFDDYDGSEPPCINCTATRDLWQFQGVQKEE